MDVQLKTRGQKFMSFKDHAGAERGNISLGRHGVKLASTTGDFCEWHPRRKGEQPFEEGDVVGFDEDSCLTRRTKSGGKRRCLCLVFPLASWLRHCLCLAFPLP